MREVRAAPPPRRFAPAASRSASACRKDARTAASTPSARKLHGTPTRRPAAPPSEVPAEVGHRHVRAGGVVGSRPQRTRREERDVLDGARERAHLVERRGEGHQAVAADAAVRGLEPDHAAERRRLPDRAARVGAQRHAREPRRHRGRRAAGRAARAHACGSQGLRVGWYALFSVDEPIANSSMFVLPSTTAPGRLQPRDDRGGERGPIALQDPRGAGRGHALDVEDVLDRDRHAGQGRRGSSGRDARRRRAAPAPARARR